MIDSLAPEVGLEPTTLRLTAECSAIELLRSVLWRLPDDRAFIVITKAARLVKGLPVESSIRSLFSRLFVGLRGRSRPMLRVQLCLRPRRLCRVRSRFRELPWCAARSGSGLEVAEKNQQRRSGKLPVMRRN